VIQALASHMQHNLKPKPRAMWNMLEVALWTPLTCNIYTTWLLWMPTWWTISQEKAFWSSIKIPCIKTTNEGRGQR